MRETIAAFVAGAVFSVGLAVGGMTQPAKVIGFLDFGGAWDPSLMFVMGAAVLVYMPLFRKAARMNSPWLARTFDLPKSQRLDLRLVVGATLFGAGWGLGGFCPGPALASLGRPSAGVGIFVGSMVAGMVSFHRLDAWWSANRSVEQPVLPHLAPQSRPADFQ